jgi:hypothetical protein
MNFLKSVGIVGVAAGMLLASNLAVVSAYAQSTGLAIRPVSNAALTAPIHNTYGKVKSIVGREFVLEIGGRNMTFVVDDNADVLARGAGRATRHAGGSLPITFFVHTGDVIRVSYRELDGVRRVSEIQMRGRSAIASR